MKIIRKLFGPVDLNLKELEKRVLEADTSLDEDRKQDGRVRFESNQDPRLIMDGTLFNLERCTNLKRAKIYEQLAQYLAESAGGIYKQYGIEKKLS